MTDWNMSCPMPRITAKGKGAALMRDVPAAARILRAMRRALTVPLTIKIRSGWDDEHINAAEVARMAESEGVNAISVHPRTRAQRHAGAAGKGRHDASGTRRWSRRDAPWPRAMP